MTNVRRKVQSFSVDSNLRICSWGAEIEKFTGKKKSEVLGKRYFDVLPKLLVNGEDIIERSIKDGRKRDFDECPLVCFCGHSRTQVRVSPLKSANRAIEKVRVDVSPPSGSLAVGDSEIFQRKIDIERLASTLAHGVRNPLNAIKGAVVFLRERYDCEKPIRDFTGIIESEISRLDDFISGFLSASILSAEPLQMDINSLVKKIELLTSFQAKTNMIKAIYEYGDVPAMIIDAIQLERVIVNVINSAIESMHSGGVLRVKTYHKDYAGVDSVLFEVSDTGAGKSVEKANTPGMPLGTKGTGLSLFATREIVQRLGGHIEIKSVKGKGTLVRLYFPISGKGVR